MLAAQLVVHLMRLLNWDEPDRGAHYTGWSPTASRYWRDVLKGRKCSISYRCAEDAWLDNPATANSGAPRQ